MRKRSRRDRGGVLTDTVAVVGLVIVLGLLIVAGQVRTASGQEGGLVDSVRTASDSMRCRNNLKQIGTAAVGLFVNNQGRLPKAEGFGFYQELYDTNTLRDPNTYVCPSDRFGRNRPVADGAEFGARNCSYWGRTVPYIQGRYSTQPLGSDQTLGFHYNHVNILFVDGHVEAMGLTPRGGSPLDAEPLQGSVGDGD